MEKLNFEDLLQQGYTSVALDSMPEDIIFTKYPINIVKVRDIQIIKKNIPKPPLPIGSNPNFTLSKNNVIVYAIINGFVYDVSKGTSKIKNGVIK